MERPQYFGAPQGRLYECSPASLKYYEHSLLLQAHVAAGLSSILVFAAERSYDLDAGAGEGDSSAAGASGPALAKGHWMLQQVTPLRRPQAAPEPFLTPSIGSHILPFVLDGKCATGHTCMHHGILVLPAGAGKHV